MALSFDLSLNELIDSFRSATKNFIRSSLNIFMLSRNNDGLVSESVYVEARQLRHDPRRRLSGL